MVVQTDLESPLPLRLLEVNRHVSQTVGVYILGREASQTQMKPEYVGGSDDDLHNRLSKWVRTGKYAFFMFKHVYTVKEAYEEECRLYHAFDNLDNEVHPDQPTGTTYSCPICGHPYN